MTYIPGGASPLTTKGDIYGYDTADARVPVGVDGQFLKADSADAQGVSWDTPAGGGDVTGPASATDSVPALFNGTTGKIIKNSTPTGTGNPVLATSPTLVTPALGTPASGSLGSCSDYEGTAVKSTGETGGTKFLREDGDGTCSWQAAGGGGKATVGFSGNTMTVPKTTTTYLGVGGAVIGVEASAEYYIPFDCTLKNLYVYVSSNASDVGGNTVTINDAGVNTSVTVTFGAGVTGVQSDTSNTHSFTAGDRFSIEAVNAAAGGGSKNIVIESVSLELTPT